MERGNKMLTCKYCGTTTTKQGTSFKNQGSLNLHEKSCLKNEEHEENMNERKEVQKGKENICPDCGSKMLLLNPRYESHNSAIKDGYSLICSKKGCGEIV